MRQRLRLVHAVAAAASALLLWLLVEADMRERRLTRLGGPFYAIDGDTLALGRIRLRLTGIDAPERAQQCRRRDGEEWQCGEAARTRLAELSGDERSHCAGSARDRYGRLLVECIRDGDSINARMVRDGMALGGTVYPGEERAARRESAGIWSGSFDNPKDWRDARRAKENASGAAAGGLWGWLAGLFAGN